MLDVIASTSSPLILSLPKNLNPERVILSLSKNLNPSYSFSRADSSVAEFIRARSFVASLLRMTKANDPLRMTV